jgi:O-antigen/teichoic acid export membrane protein
MNVFVRWTVVGTLASTGFLQLTMIIAQAVGTGTEAGMYAAALTLATPASMLARSFSLVLFPSMARATGRNDLAGVRRQADLATRGLVVIMGGLFGALILLSAPIVDLAYGRRYADAVDILPVLLAASLLVTLNVAAVNSLSATTSSGVRIPAMLSIVGMAVGLVGMFALIPSLGVLGVAWSYLAGTAVIGFGPIVVLWRRDRMRWGGLWTRFAAGAIVVVVLIWIEDRLGWGYWGDAAATAVFAVIWLLLVRRDLGSLVALKPTARH